MGYCPCERSSVRKPSMLSPVTFIMRPLICSPTGIEMGAPSALTSSPRRRPSVLSIATVRTVSSPMCCCTSITMRRPSGWVTSKASWIRGSTSSAARPWVSKATSTTGPIIWEMRPILTLVLLIEYVENGRCTPKAHLMFQVCPAKIRLFHCEPSKLLIKTAYNATFSAFII